LLALLGVFLLVERMNLRAILRRVVTEAVRWLARAALHIGQGIITRIMHTTISDAIGIILLLIAMGVLLWRIRWRIMRSSRWTRTVCPLCGSGLHRIHRRRLDRVISLLIPVGRFLCKNPECRWTGLRVTTSRARRRSSRSDA